MVEPKQLSASERRQYWREKSKALRNYRKSEIVALVQGVVNLPRGKIVDVFDAFCDILFDLASEECVIFIPRVGKFYCEPKNTRKVFNPKEGKTLYYQLPKMTFRMAPTLKKLLRKQHRISCYQMELNESVDFKPPRKLKEKSEGKL